MLQDEGNGGACLISTKSLPSLYFGYAFPGLCLSWAAIPYRGFFYNGEIFESNLNKFRRQAHLSLQNATSP
jgi:hypothetical protein